MQNQNIINVTEQLENVVNKNTDIIGLEAENLKYEYSIEPAEKLQESLKRIENTDRLLQIGIVGRVKAGKSSLLNALLFDGDPILPKAATPMTAALTLISYSDRLSAEVDFFSPEDIEILKANYYEYLRKIEEVTESRFLSLKAEKEGKSRKLSEDELTLLKEKANKQAQRELRDDMVLSACHDQYTKISNSNLNINNLIEGKILEFGELSVLNSQLLDYVGVDGKFMPFTKSVHLKLPIEKLRNLLIVDTPGINDTVQSREKRTRELLKSCDVVLIVSPSGQFLSFQDQELMDRITTKDGIRELFVIASQIDTQLFGSEKTRFNGELQKVVSGMASNLGEHMSSTLSKLKAEHPEIGTTFDQLIDQGGKKIVYSSGICQSIKRLYEERNKWDDGLQKVWENLTKHYPDYFTDNDKALSISNLDFLSNTICIHSAIEDVHEKKEEILEKRKSEFIEVKYSSLINYKKHLISYTNAQHKRIKDGSVDEIKKQKVALEKIKNKASRSIKEEYAELVDDLHINLKNELTLKLNSFFSDAKKNVDGAEETKTESYTVDNGSGFLWLRSLFGTRYETHTRTVTSVRTGAVKSALEVMTASVQDAVLINSREYIIQWKKRLNSSIIQTLRSCTDDEDLEPNLIKGSIREVLNSIKYPELEYSDSIPDGLNGKADKVPQKTNGLWNFFAGINNATGTLTGSKAEQFIDDARQFVSSFRKRVNQDINIYITSLIETLLQIDPSIKIFNSYNEKISELEEQIKSKQIVLARIEKILKELEGIS